MKVSYGPPGQRGVTTLMAVGDADIDVTQAESAIHTGTMVSALAAAAGWLVGSKTLRNMGLGGVAALVGVRMLARPPQVVAVTTPAPAAAPAATPAAGWY